MEMREEMEGWMEREKDNDRGRKRGRRVKDKNSLKGHSEASNRLLTQRQMGTNPLQRKRPDTKTTHSLLSSLPKLRFPSDFECVIISLFLETKEHHVYLLSFHLSFIYLLPKTLFLFLHI